MGLDSRLINMVGWPLTSIDEATHHFIEAAGKSLLLRLGPKVAQAEVDLIRSNPSPAVAKVSGIDSHFRDEPP